MNHNYLTSHAIIEVMPGIFGTIDYNNEQAKPELAFLAKDINHNLLKACVAAPGLYVGLVLQVKKLEEFKHQMEATTANSPMPAFVKFGEDLSNFADQMINACLQSMAMATNGVDATIAASRAEATMKTRTGQQK